MKIRIALICLICHLLLARSGMPQCVSVTHPYPLGGTIDLAEWMTMDSSLRYTNHLEPQTIGSLTWGDKIVWTKFSLAGDNWDIWAFDNDYVYFFATGTPSHWTGVPFQTADPYAPRYPQLGYPGTRLVDVCNQFVLVANCVVPPGQPGANVITELWGPLSVTYSGNIGTLDTVIVLYYWDCSGTTSNTCTHQEVNYYVRPYGWVQWLDYVAPNRDGNFQFAGGGPFDNITPGGPGFINWCLN